MTHRLQTITYVFFAAVAAVGLAACGQSSAPGGGAQAAAADHYTTRGVIVQTPNPAGHVSGLTIRHEAVPYFKTQTGGTVTMEPMAMPFPLAKGISAAELKAGDKISFTFFVNWKTNETGITSIKKLPADTKLDFSTTASEKLLEASSETTSSMDHMMSHPMGEATASP